MTATPSAAEMRLQKWMTFSAALYAVSGLAFAAAPDVVMASINLSARILGLMETPLPTERFWLVLACSMMMMLVVCCALVSRDVVKNRALCLPVIFSKFTSTILGTLYFAVGTHHAAMLSIGISDLPLGVVTLLLYRAAQNSDVTAR